MRETGDQTGEQAKSWLAGEDTGRKGRADEVDTRAGVEHRKRNTEQTQNPPKSIYNQVPTKNKCTTGTRQHKLQHIVQ